MPPGFTGRAVPRMAAPPPDVRALLYTLGVGSVTWYALLVAAPFMVWGSRKIDFDRVPRRAIALGSLVLLTTAVTATATIQYLITYRQVQRRPTIRQYFPLVMRQNVLPWVALTGVIAALEARRRGLRARVERERLRAEVAEQRLIALTAQLHPHFLFNTLQGISTLIHKNPEAADELLAKLGDLLRDLLRHRDRAWVGLDEEINYARTYLEVAQIRFADRLRFMIDVAPGLKDAAVPLFLLQPLVENALSHGNGARIEGGSIAVRATRHTDRLEITVADDGAGLSRLPPREGVGLTNTRERLRASFGEDFRFSLDPAADGGTVARLDLPLRQQRATE